MLHHAEYRAKYAENLKRELPRIPLVGEGGVLTPPPPRGPLTPSHSPPSGGEGGQGPGEGRTAGLKPRPPALQSPNKLARGNSQVFWAFAKAGKELADLHIGYETVDPYPLKFVETTTVGPGLAPAKPAQGPALRNAPLSYRVEDKMRLAKDHKSLKVNDTLTLSGIPSEAFDYRLGNRSALEWVIDQYQVTEDKKSGIRSDPNRADDPEYIVKLVGRVIRVSLNTVRLLAALPPFS